MDLNLSILIVENNPDDKELLKECLGQSTLFNCDLRETDTLESAGRLLSHYDFDVILLDIFLPDSKGLETIRSINKEHPELTVIAVSDREHDSELAVRSTHYGAQDYLEMIHLSPALLSKSIFYSLERKRYELEKEDLLNDFTQALKRLESLENMDPLCAGCSKVLSKDNVWLDLEEFVERYGQSDRGTVICPDCKKDLS